jgi:hypothetical protein
MTRSRGIITLSVVATLTLTGAAPPHNLPPCIHGPFVGITQTLADGTVIGEPDAHDWGCVGHGPGAAAGAANRDLAISGVPVGPPTAVCAYPAAPNPASAATRITFAVPTSGHVTLSVYGRNQGHGPRETSVVRSLIDGDLVAGLFEVNWDLRDDHGVPLPSGIYRVVLIVGDQALCGDVEVQ